MPESFVTGLYGCNCHPFESWAEYERAQKQKLRVGDPVTHRCTGRSGVVSRVDQGNWYLVKFGTKGVPSDHELEHAAGLIREEEQLRLF